MKKERQLTEDEEIQRGNLIAEILRLRRKQDGFFHTEWGTKTPLGLYRTVERIVKEGK